MKDTTAVTLVVLASEEAIRAMAHDWTDRPDRTVRLVLLGPELFGDAESILTAAEQRPYGIFFDRGSADFLPVVLPLLDPPPMCVLTSASPPPGLATSVEVPVCALAFEGATGTAPDALASWSALTSAGFGLRVVLAAPDPASLSAVDALTVVQEELRVPAALHHSAPWPAPGGTR